MAATSLVACPDNEPAVGKGSAGSANLAGGGTSASNLGGGGGVVGLSIPDGTRKCGSVTCGAASKCCTTTGSCGLTAPTTVFTIACIDATPRGGTKDPTCVASPEFCKGSSCQTFVGCRTTAGACGYWVDTFRLDAGETIVEIAANLGCVPVSEFVER